MMDKQKLIEQAKFWSSEDVMSGYIGTEDGKVLRKLAEIALAALEAEPDYYLSHCEDHDYSACHNTRGDAENTIAEHGGYYEELWSAPPAPANAHPDDIAFDKFAIACKAKLSQARKKGRKGWDDPIVCSHKKLADLLMQHLVKGNLGTFEDIANFAMMLHQRGASPEVLAAAAKGERFTPEEHAAVTVALNQAPTVPDEITDSIPRAKELAERLVAPGPKACAVSASETHEICDFILMVAKYLAAIEHPARRVNNV